MFKHAFYIVYEQNGYNFLIVPEIYTFIFYYIGNYYFHAIQQLSYIYDVLLFSTSRDTQRSTFQCNLEGMTFLNYCATFTVSRYSLFILVKELVPFLNFKELKLANL